MSDGKCSVKKYCDDRGLPRTTLIDKLKNAGTRAKAGIVFGYDEQTKEVYPDILDKEWFHRYKVEQAERGRMFIPKGFAQHELVADMQIMDPEDIKTIHAAAARGDYEPDDDGGEPDDRFYFKEGRLDFNEAQRVWMANKARQERIKADKLEGTLVERDAVNKQLTVAGMELRKEIERLPVKCVDAVRAAKTRQEAIMAMEDEIMKMLEAMPGIIENALKPTE
jgi:hypothetical protein